MIILSKLADYGVIVATHLALAPERQENGRWPVYVHQALEG